MTTTKELIERIRARHDLGLHGILSEAADALERLTQPVGVEPVLQVWIEGNPGVWDDCSDWAYQQAADDDRRTLYSADAVARLQAERGEALAACARLDQRLTDANHLRFREGLERDALQDQVKTLREALTLGSRYIYGEGSEEEIIEVEKALAATENKEPT